MRRVKPPHTIMGSAHNLNPTRIAGSDAMLDTERKWRKTAIEWTGGNAWFRPGVGWALGLATGGAIIAAFWAFAL